MFGAALATAEEHGNEEQIDGKSRRTAHPGSDKNRAGAKGYITKNEASTEVIKAIRCVMNGEVYASPKLTARLLGRMSGKGVTPDIEKWEKLSDRELEVFQMLGRGKNTREIAASLNLSHSTVETYRSRIREKLQLRSPAELYLFAGQWERDHGV